MLERFARYVGVGFLMFLADIVLVYALIFMGMEYLLATVIGFILAMTGAFFLNRAWTYGTHTSAWRVVYALAIALVSLVIVAWCTYWGVEYLALHYMLARSAAGILATLWSYTADSLVTFEVKPFA